MALRPGIVRQSQQELDDTDRARAHQDDCCDAQEPVQGVQRQADGSHEKGRHCRRVCRVSSQDACRRAGQKGDGRVPPWHGAVFVAAIHDHQDIDILLAIAGAERACRRTLCVPSPVVADAHLERVLQVRVDSVYTARSLLRTRVQCLHDDH
ncbi:hypothetical protein DFA_08420 [Cavenderia fasciculata]|uniref:Uncharacterized protein n=1 Tax=Cavenderia fasciculata TaxID=261658 RepID=F4Q616_CACFS|nr:uncharacterized protein DFA_08420 [Cavenderia fasciculata]EGG17425.1 hypothetical protein DFA_08420 [Cavenderia fasciculata]|eukprot:XP_004355909.1 hypothetical protein DFA_08420 [Cavenderia fasciculata]